MTTIQFKSISGAIQTAYATEKSSDMQMVFAKSTERKRKTDLMIHFSSIISDITLIPEIAVENSEVEEKISEEDRGYFEGWAADMQDETKHGQTVSVSITNSGNGEHRVWDFYKQQVVDIKDLTIK